MRIIVNQSLEMKHSNNFTLEPLWVVTHTATLGARDFSCPVSGFGRRPKTCRPAADETPRHTREKLYGTQGSDVGAVRIK